LVKNTELLRDMIEAVLCPAKPIRDTYVLNPDIPKDYPGDKAIILDVRVRLDDGSQIDLEMQSTAPTGTAGRFLYYWARDFVDTMRSGDDYTGLCPCISILWFKQAFLKNERFHSVFHLSEDETREVFSTLIEMHVLELPKLTLAPLERQARIERWARFFRADTPAELERLAAEDPIMSTAVHTLETISSDPEMQRQAREREDAQLTLLPESFPLIQFREMGREWPQRSRKLQ
jgi:predicted transposase/invertase (TIGR01784 family)